MFEAELNIVDTINRKDIEGEVPKEAQYAGLSLNGEFIQKFYRFQTVKFNDSTENEVLQYFGEQGGWHNSSYNDKDGDYKKLKDVKFLKIIS